jgi:hypothetical protein
VIALAVPAGAEIINTHEDLIKAFVRIDQRLHRIAAGSDPPYIWQNKLYLPASMYSIFLGAIGSGGERVSAADASGRQPVVEENSATISSNLASAKTYLSYLSSGFMAMWDANGALVDYAADRGWHAITPMNHTADGAGAVTAGSFITNSGGGDATDANIYLQADTTGTYSVVIVEDPGGGAEGPCIPAFNVTIPMIAGARYGPFRVMCTTDDLDMGFDAQGNGSWPNGASLTVYGDYREV